MPFLIDYTAPTGTNYPNSWWELGALNLNFPNKTVTLTMYGYVDRVAYRDGLAIINTYTFSYNDPLVFDTVFYGLSYTAIDQYLYIGAPFIPEAGEYPFNLASSTWARTDVSSGIAGYDPAGGLVPNTSVYVTFQDNVDTGTDYTTGVTIKVNGVAATISSGVRQLNHKVVLYTLSAAIPNEATLTFEYTTTGQIAEEATQAALGPVPPVSLTNVLGGTLGFNTTNSSGHIAHI